MTRTNEVRHGRNFIREGDPVTFTEHFTRSNGDRVWRKGKFLFADEDKGGPFYCILEEGGGGFRCIRPERVKRKSVATERRKKGRS